MQCETLLQLLFVFLFYTFPWLDIFLFFYWSFFFSWQRTKSWCNYFWQGMAVSRVRNDCCVKASIQFCASSTHFQKHFTLCTWKWLVILWNKTTLIWLASCVCRRVSVTTTEGGDRLVTSRTSFVDELDEWDDLSVRSATSRHIDNRHFNCTLASKSR